MVRAIALYTFILKISGSLLVSNCCLEFPEFGQILQGGNKGRSVTSPTQTTSSTARGATCPN
jgi:hypothetical protein